jgi:hypothetical protein
MVRRSTYELVAAAGCAAHCKQTAQDVGVAQIQALANVKGNYNATGVNRSGLGSTDVTPSERYMPYNTPDHIPASIVADAVTILSNSWQDSLSFRYPFNKTMRIPSETTLRFAMDRR